MQAGMSLSSPRPHLYEKEREILTLQCLANILGNAGQRQLQLHPHLGTQEGWGSLGLESSLLGQVRDGA